MVILLIITGALSQGREGISGLGKTRANPLDGRK
jgi:hypothetical protein